MGRIITLREHREIYTALSEGQVSHVEASLAGKVEVLPTAERGQVILRSSSHVGFAQLPDDCTLVIEPKIPIATLLFLLALVYDPSSAFFRDEPARFTTVSGMFEFVVHLFAVHVEDLIARGILRGYQDRREDLQAIRGRLLIAETIQRRPVLRDRHWCRFSHFTEDVPENIILNSTIHMLHKYVYADNSLPRRLRHISRSLPEVSLSSDPLELLAALTYHRLNEHYRPALMLAYLLLKHLTFSGATGEEPFLAFMIDMDWLFKRVVGALLRRQSGLLHAKVREQVTSFCLDFGKEVKVRPDVVLQRGRQPIFVLDVKYKLDPDRADVYQVLAYCHALGLEEAALVYPQGELAPSRSLIIREPGNVRIHYLGLDLSGGPEDILAAGEELAERVGNLIRYSYGVEDRRVKYSLRS